MSDHEMQWMKHAEGVGVSLMTGNSAPQDGNAYVRLGKPSLDAIRQIVKDEVHKALCLDKDDEDDGRDWTVRQVMCAYGMSQHDAEVFMQQREVQDDEDRVEPNIVTVQGSERDFGVAMHKLTTDAGTSAQEVEEISRKILLMAASPPPSLTVTCTHMERRYRGTVYLVEEAKDE